MTVLCAIVTGTHRIKAIIIISKSKKTRSFKGTAASLENLPVVYTNKKSSWMKNDLFKDWFFIISYHL